MESETGPLYAIQKISMYFVTGNYEVFIEGQARTKDGKYVNLARHEMCVKEDLETTIDSIQELFIKDSKIANNMEYSNFSDVNK